MKKRLSSKVLAVILTLAICASTVLGCLMTASAAEACYYFNNANFMGDDLTEATIDLTFTKPASAAAGITAGEFSIAELGADASDCLVLKGIQPKTGEVSVELVNGEGDDKNVSIDDNHVLFLVENSAGEAETVTLQITFGFSAGEASLTGKEYKVTLNDVELALGSSLYIEQNKASGLISAGCKHVIAPVGAPLKADTENNYSVYEKSVCTLCGEQFGYQLVPTAGELSGDNASAGTIDILEFGDYLTAMGSTSTYFDNKLADNGETGDSWENAIIIDSAEEFVYLSKASGNDTAGKYYKVADGIAGFDLSGGRVDITKGYAENESAIKGSGKNHAGGTPGFQGHFDGNGITVYGAWTNHTQVSNYAGLFSCVQGDVTIKNVNVRLSAFTAKNAAGGIVGYHKGNGEQTLTIENCSVADSYIEITTATYGNGVAGLVGYSANLSSWKESDKGVDGNGDGDMSDTIYVNGKAIVKNCYVNFDPANVVGATKPGVLTDTTIRGTYGGLVGFMTSNGLDVSNCISIGITPYAVQVCTTQNDVQHSGLETHFKNVYTDQASGKVSIGGSSLGTRDFTGKVYQVSESQLKGSAAVNAMPNLAWGSTWVMDSATSYPRLAKPGEKFDTIYWDGSSTKTAPTVGGGTKDNPYIISTVAEFAYITGQTKDKYTVTDGKYYKIADGIKNIVMQPYAYGSEIMALSSAAETKAYFEANGSKLKQWLYYGWEQSTFCGNIDFNGATVYGAYIKDSANNAALISNVDAGAVISNLALKNCYFTSAAGNYQVGAIVAVTNADVHGKSTNGFVWIKNCTVANNYLYNTSTSHDRSGVLVGGSSDIVYVDNCLVYDNDAKYGSDVVMPILGSANNGVDAAVVAAPEGLVTKTSKADLDKDGVNDEDAYCNMVRNSIILGTYPHDNAQGAGSRFNDPNCYENVYTDMNVSKLGTVKPEQISVISASDAKGSAAQTNMPNLAWGTDWIVGGAGEYPSQAIFVEFGVSDVTAPELSLVGSNIGYNDDGTFDFNLHFVPEAAGQLPVLHVVDKDLSKFYEPIVATASSKRGELGANAVMYTLPNISARDLEKVWLPTLVSKDGALVTYGQSQVVAIADNAKAIIEGNYDAADKNVAAALINYGAAAVSALAVEEVDYNPGTIDLLEFGQYLKDAGSTSTYFDTNVADNGETGTANDPIIIDSAEEFVYLAKASGNETAGKFYKVADGIAGFDLSNGKLDYTKGYAENEAVIKGSGKNHAGNTPGFQGTFDGNGITVYGAWTNHTDGNVSNYAGLFSCTKNSVTIKNVNVKFASFTAKTAAGGIIGYHAADEMCTVTVENCSITESHIETTGTGYGAAIGAIIGRGDSAPALREANDQKDYNGDGDMTDTIYRNVAYNVKNCYVNLDEKYFVSKAEDGVEESGERVIHGGVVGFAASNAVMTSDSIVIGVKPYSTTECTTQNDIQHTGHANNYNNVYTDQIVGKEILVGGTTGKVQDLTTVMTELSTAQLTGLEANKNMTTLDWDTVWTTTTGYPTFVNAKYEAPSTGRVLSWDGSVATGIATGSGTKANPYIINTAAELAWLVQQKGDVTVDKYYKVADGISAIVLQSASKVSDIMALDSAAAVKAYFESGSHTQWKTTGWETASFCGNFDGNGATIYGMYATSSNNAALFCTVDAGATIKNVAVKNAYLTSSANNYQVAAIAAVASSSGYGAKSKGVLAITGCTVANCYMRSKATTNDRTGVLYGAASEDAIYIANCLVYGNDAYYGANYENKTALVGVTSNGIAKSTAKLPEGITPKTSTDADPLYYNEVRDTVILGCDVMNVKLGRGWRKNDAGCYTNVYTDMAGLVDGVITYPTDNTTFTYAESNIKKISAADILGANAKTVMPNLAWDSIWYTGVSGDMPSFKPAGAMSNAAQTLYDGMVFDTYDNYGDSVTSFGVYTTGLNLKANPYMTFTFEFGGEYAQSKDVVVTFKSGNKVIKTVTAADMINNVDKGAGRFHLYRLENAPVTALATGITVSVSYNGGAAVNFGTYSAEGFALMADHANKVEPCDYYATRYEAAKALLFYAQMLVARYGA